MAAPPRRVLFVCTGNVCRSVTAERLLLHEAGLRGLELEVRSCGVAAEPYYEVPEPVRRLLSGAGVAAFKHAPRLATRELLRWADLVLVMTAGHLDYLHEVFPELSARTFLLRGYAGLDEKDVEDPMGGADEAYAASFAQVREAIAALLGRLAAKT